MHLTSSRVPYETSTLPMFVLSTISNLSDSYLSGPVCAAASDREFDCTVTVSDAERVVVARYFASFLPGISMALCRVVTGDSKQGHHVIEVSRIEVQ